MNTAEKLLKKKNLAILNKNLAEAASAELLTASVSLEVKEFRDAAISAISAASLLVDLAKLPIKVCQTPPVKSDELQAAEKRMLSVDINYMPVYPGGQMQFDKDVQLFAAAYVYMLRKERG